MSKVKTKKKPRKKLPEQVTPVARVNRVLGEVDSLLSKAQGLLGGLTAPEYPITAPKARDVYSQLETARWRLRKK
jgi:hypothetical protein